MSKATFRRFRFLSLTCFCVCAPLLAQPGLTGVHFGTVSDFPTLKQIGYDFVVTTVSRSDPSSWWSTIDAAQTNGLKLVLGAWPPPYRLNRTTGTWTISPAGVDFIRYLSTRPDVVMAIFVFNEPYWTNPSGTRTFPCGWATPANLRALRTQIRGIWPDAKIYHDLDDPADYAPGGWYQQATPCIGNTWADQTGVADYVGIFYFPFNVESGYTKQDGLDFINTQVPYVLNSMNATPVFLGQAFRCPNSNGCSDGDGTAMPTAEQLLDWNCTLRQALPPSANLSWYVWQPTTEYDDWLALHSDYWPNTLASACETADFTLPRPARRAADASVSASAISRSATSRSPEVRCHLFWPTLGLLCLCSVLQFGARGLKWKLRRSLRARGVVGTIKVCTAALVRPASRMHADPGPSTFFLRFGVDTSGYIHIDDLDVDATRWADACGYQGTPPEMFREAMRHLPICHCDFTFVDVGCGKGLILLLASDYPFRRIIRVDFSPNLIRIAQENIRTYSKYVQGCRDIQAICQDALELEFPLDPLVVFMCNPFVRASMTRSFENLATSRRQQPRDIFVIYFNPFEECCFGRSNCSAGASPSAPMVTPWSTASTNYEFRNARHTTIVLQRTCVGAGIPGRQIRIPSELGSQPQQTLTRS